MARYLPVLLLLFIIAVSTRDDFALTLIYLCVVAFAAGSWWSHKSLAGIEHERHVSTHAFLGEKIDVRLRFHNRGWLPVLWLSIQDGLPVSLSTQPSYTQVTSLAPKATLDFSYSLDARKRGYYPIGPLYISSGDILGLNEALQIEKPAQYITVYPKIITLRSVRIPSRSPQGTLRHTHPIFEDPTRVFSKREYVAGDSLRRVDWKSSASSGHLQVKLFEPSIALETLIFLDLNTEDYDYRSAIDSSELAVVIAASLATWIAGKNQTVGLKVNGRDPLHALAAGLPQYLPPGKGQAHLMRILEILARVQMSNSGPLEAILQQQRYHLAWGTTLIVISGQASQALLDELYQARRAGQNALLVLAGPVGHLSDITQRAAHFGIPVVCIANERDLDIWRK